MRAPCLAWPLEAGICHFREWPARDRVLYNIPSKSVRVVRVGQARKERGCGSVGQCVISLDMEMRVCACGNRSAIAKE